MLIIVAASLPRFVMYQDVALCLLIHNVYIVVGQVYRFHPITGSINYYRGASTISAARNQHRHQEDD